MKKFKLMLMLIFTVLFSGLFIIGCIEDHSNEPDPEKPESLHGKVIILQAYGSSSDAAGVSHSFVELYNVTNNALKLDGIGLYYADGTTVDSGQNTANKDGAWKRISLNGKTIPAKGSFLVLGPKQSANARYQIPENSGDINSDTFTLSNRAFKVALIQSTENITVQNPFTANSGKPIKGYIDMVGAANEYQGQDLIFGFEKAPARNSASEAVRRADLIDYDDNSTDFIAARYALSGNGAMSNEMLEARRPRNSSAGTWNPFAPPVIGEGSSQLMILQVFGMHANNDSAPTHSFIELYNNTNETINLSAYSVHWANGNSSNANAPTEKDVWHKINLTGSISAKNSYLILGPQVVDATTIADSTANGKLNLTTTTADVTSATFLMSNRSYKVALMSNQTDLAVANPWGNAACIDLVSAINTSGTDSVTAAKGAADLTAVNASSGGNKTISKQKSFRRVSLTVSDNTLADFSSVQYSSVSDDDIAKFRPRSTSAGVWTPQF
ncbi:MAG: hypothetical protein LBQ82_00955 [Treponema sp.]|jgi:hypothetical protein|nr:hypothetical protein [Treponema sp.]